MEKPLVLAIEDFKKNLSDLINNSTIPLSVVADILASLIPAVQSAAEQQYKVALEEYNKQLQSAEDGEKEIMDDGTIVE